MRSAVSTLIPTLLILLWSGQALAGAGFADSFDLPADATYVGSETCLDCHEKQEEKLIHSPHSLELNPYVPGSDITSCEACHGPGSVHAEDEEIEAIINVEMLRNMDGIQRDAMCLQCHVTRHAGWSEGPHQGTGVSCADCHADQIHYRVQPKPVAQFRNESEFCIQCHATEVTDFRLPFRHRVLEGQIMCGDCHDPHNGFPTDGWNGLNETCLGCHTEMAGPFVFEHDGVQSEDCITCHKPHGSTHDKLLVTDSNTLCLQCHYESGFNADENWSIGGYPHAVETGLVQNEGRCYDCHTEIHGSNVAPSFMDQ